MKDRNCWLCGNTMIYKGIINTDVLGKSHNWECGVCGEGVLRKVKPTLNYNCHICNGEYIYLEDKEMEELELVVFKCKTCGDEVGVSFDHPYLEGWDNEE